MLAGPEALRTEELEWAGDDLDASISDSVSTLKSEAESDLVLKVKPEIESCSNPSSKRKG